MAGAAPGDYAEANLDGDGNGYTELEEYLEWMALPHAFTTIDTAVTIDLAKAFAGYDSSPNYISPAATFGSVVIAGKTASFTATACGFADFQLKVTDNTGATMTKRYAVFVDGKGMCP